MIAASVLWTVVVVMVGASLATCSFLVLLCAFAYRRDRSRRDRRT